MWSDAFVSTAGPMTFVAMTFVKESMSSLVTEFSPRPLGCIKPALEGRRRPLGEPRRIVDEELKGALAEVLRGLHSLLDGRLRPTKKPISS